MAYIRGVDVVGSGIMGGLGDVSGALADYIKRQQTAPLIQKLFNPTPTVNPNAGAIPLPGDMGTIPLPSVTPGPPPFAPQNTGDLTRLAQTNPEALKTAMAAYQMRQPSFFDLSAGQGRYAQPAGGGAPFLVASQPNKDMADKGDRQIVVKTRKLPNGEVHNFATGIDKTTMKEIGEVDLGLAPPTAAGAAAQNKYVPVKNAMGATTGFVNPNSQHYIDANDIEGMPSPQAPLTSSTKTMIEASPKVKDFVAKISPEIDKVASQLGPAAGRWSEFMTGKVGADNPEYTALRTNIGLLSTLLMRMHVGARGGEYIMKHFQDLIDQGKQSPANLKAALGEINDYADQVMAESKTGVGTAAPAAVPDPMGIR